MSIRTLILLLLIPTFAHAQTTLHIGDTAPGIQYSKWLKGTPVKDYAPGHLYVFEFWATWCGPCKAAMPHLSELAKKYEKEATIIGVNIYEKTGDQPYESCLPAVTKFVNSMGDKMAYNVIADNNGQYMSEHWMKAAGQNGIPCTFVIKDNQVLWVGHPIKLDSTLELVLSGKYDLAGARAEFDRRQAANDAQTASIKAAFDPVNAAVKAQDYRAALRLIDTAIMKVPLYAIALNNMKFTTLLDHFSEDTAIAFAKKWLQQTPGMEASIGAAISEKDGLSKSTYLYAAGLLKATVSTPGIVVPIIYNRLAVSYAKAGDYTAAADAQKSALEEAKLAFKADKWPGTIMDYTITDYESELNKYKKKMN